MMLAWGGWHCSQHQHLQHGTHMQNITVPLPTDKNEVIWTSISWRGVIFENTFPSYFIESKTTEEESSVAKELDSVVPNCGYDGAADIPNSDLTNGIQTKSALNGINEDEEIKKKDKCLELPIISHFGSNHQGTILMCRCCLNLPKSWVVEKNADISYPWAFPPCGNQADCNLLCTSAPWLSCLRHPSIFWQKYKGSGISIHNLYPMKGALTLEGLYLVKSCSSLRCYWAWILHLNKLYL